MKQKEQQNVEEVEVNCGIFARKKRPHAEMENGRNAATEAATRG